VVLQPFTASRPIVIGATADQADTLTITAADLAAIDPAVSSLTIGSAAGTGTITTAGDVTFSSAVLIRNPGANSSPLFVSNTLDSAGHSLTLLSGNQVGLFGSGRLLSHGGNITATGASSDPARGAGIYLAAVTIDAGTGNITLNGSVTGVPGGSSG